MKRGTGLKRSPMKARTTPMPRGTNTLKRGAQSERFSGGAERRLIAARKPVRETGFSRQAKEAIRARAGNGSVDDARCEACAIWLGRYGGQIQHRCARGAGGSRLRNNIANGTLLCGTPETGDHGLCEQRDPHMHEAGFWCLQSEDPLQVPIMLHGRDGGVLVWLDDLGNYLIEKPGVTS